jgi:hypothetical protein
MTLVITYIFLLQVAMYGLMNILEWLNAELVYLPRMAPCKILNGCSNELCIRQVRPRVKNLNISSTWLSIRSGQPRMQYINDLNPNRILWEDFSVSHILPLHFFTILVFILILIDVRLVNLYLYYKRETLLNV